MPPEDDNIYPSPYTIDIYRLSELGDIKVYMDGVRVLPKPLYFLMTDQSTAKYLNENLAQRYRLTPEQIKDLTRIVRDVLLSTIYIGDLATEIQTRVRVEAGMAREIGNALVGELFKPVMADIKALQLAHFADRISGGPAAKPAPRPDENNLLNLRRP